MSELWDLDAGNDFTWTLIPLFLQMKFRCGPSCGPSCGDASR
jgi:hypothetical protein